MEGGSDGSGAFASPLSSICARPSEERGLSKRGGDRGGGRLGMAIALLRLANAVGEVDELEVEVKFWEFTAADCFGLEATTILRPFVLPRTTTALLVRLGLPLDDLERLPLLPR